MEGEVDLGHLLLVLYCSQSIVDVLVLGGLAVHGEQVWRGVCAAACLVFLVDGAQCGGSSGGKSKEWMLRASAARVKSYQMNSALRQLGTLKCGL